MILVLLAYLGGALTIVSPCILPVLPFVFARADRPFLQNGLPTLIGMALTFAVVASLAAVGGGWAVAANEYGRYAALALMAAFGLTLIFPALSERLTRPLVDLGNRLSRHADAQSANAGSPIAASLLLGVAIGLLWAPCAGPILGLILTGAALQGANVQTTLLLLAYALGAATSLALALLLGGRVFAAMKQSLGTGDVIRRGVGVAVVIASVAIAFGLDTGLLARMSANSTTALEQRLLDAARPKTEPNSDVSSNIIMPGDEGKMSGGPAMMAGNDKMMAGGPAMMSGNDKMAGGAAMMSANPAMMAAKSSTDGKALPIEGIVPSIAGAVEWLNSEPLSVEALKGKVVLIDFWTYSCINCLRTIPYVRAWAEKYKDQGLVVIGVHTPEFAFEKKVSNVRTSVADLKIDYPVAVDNDYTIWRAFKNQYWPAHYFIDAQGRIRHHHFGEGDYEKSERIIQQLLAEAGKASATSDIVTVKSSGMQAPGALDAVKSPETYVGYDRAENFISEGGIVKDAAHTYTSIAPRLNEWGLKGDWTVNGEHAALNANNGSIVYRFHARDLHLVLGPADGGKPVRIRVTIDGAAPGDSHGMDIDADGNGVISHQRLYQLVRQNGQIADRTFEIEFLDPGVQAFAFTFG